jgi:hypothetical protein
MGKLVKYDLYRAFRQVSTYVLLAITLVFAVISALDVTFFSGESGSDLLLTFGNALASGKDILLMLSGCMCGLLIGEDFSIGSYSLGVSSGYSRWKILGGRTVSCFIVISLMLAVYMLASVAISMLYVKVFGFADVIRLIGLSCLHIVHFCALNMLCILLCFVLKKKVNATAVCLFVNLILLALLGLLCSKVELLTSLYLKSVPVIMYTMFGETENVLIVLGSTLIHLILAAAIFFAAGKIFEKEELA